MHPYLEARPVQFSSYKYQFLYFNDRDILCLKLAKFISKQAHMYSLRLNSNKKEMLWYIVEGGGSIIGPRFENN